ncbi:MAG TPA: CotH kinase family protein [Bacteroidia bacterium]
MQKKPFCRFFLSGILVLLLVGTGTTNAQLVINEWSASNISNTADNFGNYEDWIELYNAGTSAVNLAGYHLSDKATNPTKWTFTSGSIAPNGLLLVWASGRNISTGPNYHTNFSLLQTKPKMIVLADPGGIILDSLTLRPAQKNHSRGRTTNGNTTWGVFTNPTPGANNSGAMQNYATKPSMSVAAGFYSSAQTVTISSPDPNITIYYTTDGSTPTTSSTQYTSPVNIAATTVLRAKAFSSTPSIPASFVESNTYFINVSHTVPVVSIFGDQIQTLMNGTQISPQTGLEFFDKNGVFKTESYGESNKHGNDSWSYPQRGIDFVSIDEYGYNYQLKNQFFTNSTRTGFKRVILKAAASDNYPFEDTSNPCHWGPNGQLNGCHIRDAYIAVLSENANLHLDSRKCTFTILFVNGQYWGVYDFREKVDDKDFTNYYYNQDTPDIEFLQTWGGTWEAYSPTVGQAQNDWNSFVNFVTSNNMALPANYNYVDSVYNVKSLADYMVLNSYVVCSDWLNWNTEWWRGLDTNGQHKKWAYCLWDEDATFGHYINWSNVPNTTVNADPCNPQSMGDPGGQGHIPVLNALLTNPTFKQYYISRFIDLSNTYFKCTYMQHVLDSMVAVIQPEMTNHCAKWGGSVTQWQQNVTDMKNWIDTRCQVLAQGLMNCYNLTGPYNLAVNVVPAGAGTVKINSITPGTYWYNGSYFGNINILFKANANSGYVFDYWEVNHDTVAATINDSNVTMMMTQGDTVIAHFRLNGNPPPPPPPNPNVEGEVSVPNAFSPNGDGNNDILFVLGNNVQHFELNIYNRWGQRVFTTTNQADGWDGTFKGQKLNNGVFAYSLVYTTYDGSQHQKKGNITLIR